MYDNLVYSTGAILNVLVLCYCCKKWKTVGNIKLLVAVQAVLSCLTISANLGLVTENVHWFSKEKFLCFELPSIMIFFLGLAIFNFTCLVCVKCAQIADHWHLRRSFAVLIFLTELGFTLVLLFPIFHSIYKGWSILIRFDEGSMGNNTTNISDTEAAKEIYIFNTARYVFWFLVLQFLVPSFIIASRVMLILIHLWQEETTTDSASKPNNLVAIRFTVNAIFTILFAVAVIFLSIHKSLDDMNSDEALDFLNKRFREFALSFVIVLCSPWYLVEMIYSECTKDEEFPCLIPEYTKQKESFNI